MTLQRRSVRWLVATLAAIHAIGCAADAAELRTFSLRHRPAASLVSSIKALLDDGEAVTAHGNILIVKASSAKLSQLQSVLETLDKPDQRLRITVLQTAGRTLQDLTAGGFNVQLGSGTTGAAASGHVYQLGGQDNRESVQQVAALDGQAAEIHVANEVPTTHGLYYGDIAGRGIAAGIQFEQRTLTRGFTVLPRVLAGGQEVVIEITPQSDQPDPYRQGAAERSALTTTTRAKLGEWIEIGAQNQVLDGAAGHRYETQQQRYRIFARIDRE